MMTTLAMRVAAGNFNSTGLPAPVVSATGLPQRR